MKLIERNPQIKFMALYYWYKPGDYGMGLEINPSLNAPNRSCSPYLSKSIAGFDLTMRRKTHGILDLLRSEFIPLIFANKFGQVSSDRASYTDGSETNDFTGFGRPQTLEPPQYTSPN